MKYIGFNSETNSSFISRHHIKQTNSYLLWSEFSIFL